jgi:HEAT repeat protein
MGNALSVIHWQELDSSALVLITLAALGVVTAILFQIGLLGWALHLAGAVVRRSVQAGFDLWRRLFAWADWLRFFALVLGLFGLGWAGGAALPWLWVLCGSALLIIGVTACLAYMFIDLERYEVGHGYKALHNPLKGQTLAVNLVRYGHQVGVPLLIAATVAMICGFAMLNQGLYHTVGREWYTLSADKPPRFLDFLAYPLNNLFRIVDLLDLAGSYHFLQATYVRPVKWPASALLVAFKTFFTLVLLQQIFASLRQGRLLAETIAEFWSPHEPIHERARGALPQHGVGIVRPLLASLRSVPPLTKEQRDVLPVILAQLGPACIPALLGHLEEPHEVVRAVAAAALGRLRSLDALPELIRLREDPSELVRQSVVEALGIIGGPGGQAVRRRSWFRRRSTPRRWFGGRERTPDAHQLDRVESAVATLRSALADASAAVRIGAVQALGLIGHAAAAVTPDLIASLQDSDETVRCRAAEALGKIGGGEEATVPALVALLEDPSPQVKDATAQALGALKKEAAEAVPALVPLLQDREESVRQAAAEAIGRVGPLTEKATESLAEGLSSPDTVVRARTAEALGTIGAAAGGAAPALVEALSNGTDQVRAKAAEALGKIGEAAAEAAVPSLVRALRDKDDWVSALAAEALGEMGGVADQAVPVLVRSLRHISPHVRANAAEALGKMGAAAAVALPALEAVAKDEDGGVRSQAVRALGEIGQLTPPSGQVIRTGLEDADPLVRAAAVEAVGKWGEVDEATTKTLLALLEDPNDQVKVQVTRVLPKLVGPTTAVVGGLCRRLLEDDSVWIQESAALALGQLGPGAAAAGGALLRAAQTAEATVREQAMRAVALIQPPETAAAFTSGLKDASGEIRKVASGGWMKAAEIPEEVIPALVEALQDPEVQVRANAAHALARLDSLPGEAIPLLVECTADPNDGLRMNAAVALKGAPLGAVGDVFRHLIEDANSRVRLIAAGSLLAQEPDNPQAAPVVVAALSDPAVRLRRVALEAIASLGPRGAAFLASLRQGLAQEDDPEMRESMACLIERLESQVAEEQKPAREGVADRTPVGLPPTSPPAAVGGQDEPHGRS